MIFYIYFNIFMIVLAVVAIWAMYNNHRTFRQRVSLLHRLPSPDGSTMEEITEAILRYHDYERVSYDSHFMALMTLQDPKKLYPPSIQQYM